METQTWRTKHTDTKGGRWDGMNWEIGVNIYTLLILCTKKNNYFIAQGTLLNAL